MEDLTFVKAKVGILEDAIELTNKGYWHVTFFYSDKRDEWLVYGGDILIFRCKQREMVDVFLYGMGFALTAMPHGGFDSLKRQVE